MILTKKILSLIFFHFLIFYFYNSQALTLDEAFRAAQSHYPLIKNLDKELKIANLKKEGQTSELKPTVELSSVSTLRDEVNSGGVSSSFGEGYQHTALVNVTHNIFQGGVGGKIKEQANNLPELQKITNRISTLEVYRGIVQIFYQVINFSEQEKLFSELLVSLDKRVSFLKRRVAIGRSRRSELLANESQRAKVAAEISLNKLKLNSALTELKKITGLNDIDQLRDPLVEPLKYYIDKFVNAPDELNELKNAQLNLEQSKLTKLISKQDFWPSVDLSGNAYLDRAGVLADSKWDINLTAKWNLYAGGESDAKFKESVLEVEKIENELIYLKKSLEETVTQNRILLDLKSEQLIQLEKAAKSSEQSYKENLKDYERGLVSELELLRSMEDYITTKRTYMASSIEPKLLFFDWIISKGHTL